MSEHAFVNKKREDNAGVWIRCMKEGKDIGQFDCCPAIIVVTFIDFHIKLIRCKLIDETQQPQKTYFLAPKGEVSYIL